MGKLCKEKECGTGREREYCRSKKVNSGKIMQRKGKSAQQEGRETTVEVKRKMMQSEGKSAEQEGERIKAKG